MSEFNKSYRIRTDVGKDKALKVKLDQQYDILEIMSLKIDQKNLYKLHTSNYGVIAGRVLANGGFGIPNAKISVFIGIDNQDMNDIIKSIIYPYNQTSSKDKNNVRYNLLPNEQLNDCHTIIGTFPSKQLVLDNDILLEIFEKYYKFTTKTNESGDYMIFGVPTGVQTIHVDIDLSDVGILSQKPRDMIYKGYNINQFENPNKFKYDTNLNSLAQVISEDTVTEVIPFWGDEEEGTIGITRCDVNVNYKFEPTCVFMGSVVSDSPSNGFSTKCIPTPGMGAMDELTTGSGTIEMIRKTPSGDVEEVQIQGTQLINGDGIWCYQIPMNLDYMKTDEFGKMVPTDDPSKGIATRTRVRFRMSMQDSGNDIANINTGKILVPHNPSNNGEIDYDFGTNTKDHSYRDLLWNCVYSVKSYIPRIQKGSNWKNEKFTGFKRVNYYNDNNPLPYNNIRIKIPFMYSILCIIINLIIKIIGFANVVWYYIQYMLESSIVFSTGATFLIIDGTLCNESLDNYCIIPGVDINKGTEAMNGLVSRTLLRFVSTQEGNIKDSDLTTDVDKSIIDENSIDRTNNESNTLEAGKSGENAYVKGVKITDNINYIIHCIELNLAQEYKVIQFDFYNDWMNGLLYFPRWMRNVTKKRTFLFWIIKESEVKGCNESFTKNNINIVQQCGLEYDDNHQIKTNIGCKNKSNKLLICHKSSNVRLSQKTLQNGGVIVSSETIKKQKVYYYKPIENKVILYSTDIILLGNLNPCNIYGIPNFFNELISSTYQMPPNMVFTDSDIEGPLISVKDNNENIIMEPDEGTGNWFNFGLDWCSFIPIIGPVVKFLGGDCGAKDDGVKVKKIEYNGNYMNLNEDDKGYNTLLSGVDWVHNGPGQKLNDDNLKQHKMYKPGGHFLGLSCVNSETTIKTCVNLSRICELNVNMSQRKELNIIENKDYASIPTGLISVDEINSGNGRRIFATLNHNTLRITDNYGGYNFTTINPNNFGGELYNDIKSLSEYNRFINSGHTEIIWEPTNDEYTKFEQTNKSYIYETNIRRTGEYVDNEYIKFRFGGETPKYLQNNKFPLYKNSFYFYFGLHDGKTAIDEFKKQYYANCNSKDEENSSIKISVTPENMTDGNFGGYMEYCTLKDIETEDYAGDGKVNYKISISINENNLNYGYYYCISKIESNDECSEKLPLSENINTIGEKEFIVTKYLSKGDYRLLIYSLPPKETTYKLEKEFIFNVKGEKYNIDVIGNNFNLNYTINIDNFISNYKENLKTLDDLVKQGGYIKIDKQYTVDIGENDEYEIINEERNFNSNIKFKVIINDIELSIESKDDNYVLYYNNQYVSLFTDETYLYIPVPFGDENYTINVLMYDKIKYISTVYISNGKNIDFEFNNVPYSRIHNLVSNYSNDNTLCWYNENFWNNLQSTYKQRLFDAIFVDNLVDNNGQEKFYNISIISKSQNPPTQETLKINNNNVTQPLRVSVNNITSEDLTDTYYEYQCIDILGYKCPTESPFKFPIIFKPLFMKINIIGDILDGNNCKYTTTFNIYNGIRSNQKNLFILEYKKDINNVKSPIGSWSTWNDYTFSYTVENNIYKDDIVDYIIGGYKGNIKVNKTTYQYNYLPIFNNLVLCEMQYNEFNKTYNKVEYNNFNYLEFNYNTGKLYDWNGVGNNYEDIERYTLFSRNDIKNISKEGRQYKDWYVKLSDDDKIMIIPNYEVYNDNKNNDIENCYTFYKKNDIDITLTPVKNKNNQFNVTYSDSNSKKISDVCVRYYLLGFLMLYYNDLSIDKFANVIYPDEYSTEYNDIIYFDINNGYYYYYENYQKKQLDLSYESKDELSNKFDNLFFNKTDLINNGDKRYKYVNFLVTVDDFVEFWTYQNGTTNYTEKLTVTNDIVNIKVSDIKEKLGIKYYNNYSIDMDYVFYKRPIKRQTVKIQNY